MARRCRTKLPFVRSGHRLELTQYFVQLALMMRLEFGYEISGLTTTTLHYEGVEITAISLS
jgi:hypothetical protein